MPGPARPGFVRLPDEVATRLVAGLDQSAFGSLPDEPATYALAATAVIDTSNTIINLSHISYLSLYAFLPVQGG